MRLFKKNDVYTGGPGIFELVVIGLLIAVLIVLIGLGIVNIVKKGSKSDKTEKSKVNIEEHDDRLPPKKVSKTFITNSGTITIEDQLYDVTPGYTFYVDKGNVKLYADIIPTNDGNLMVTGKQFHMDEEMKDDDFKELFTLQSDGTFANAANNISLNYEAMTAEFTDHRSNVALPFNGKLELILNEVLTGDDANIDYSNMISVNIATPIDEVSENDLSSFNKDDINIDELSDDTGNKNNDFSKDLIPANERKTMTITAKYIESTSNSGTKYIDIQTGIEFYAFGRKFPYDPKECNTVTITGVYRGNEKNFNGLHMDDKYPCFVISNIRKPNASEVR